MGAPKLLRVNFNRVADVYVRDARFAYRPSLRIEDRTFHDILEPVEHVFEGSRIYPQKQKMDIPEMIEELRCMCLEAQTTHSTKDISTRERRTELLNILQSIKEKAEEGVDANGMRAADMDFFSLPELTDVMREAAMTHSEYLHNNDIAEVLSAVAGNIESAEKRLWRPRLRNSIDTSGLAADDYMIAPSGLISDMAADDYHDRASGAAA